MKYLIIILFLLTGCGKKPSSGGSKAEPMFIGPEASRPVVPSCYVSIEDGHKYITCPDGSKIEITDGKDGENGAAGINGQNGQDGIDGQDGSNGHSVVYSLLPADSCSAGGQTILLAQDINDNLSLDITDSNIHSLTICNGQDGVNGQDGQNGQDGVDAPPTMFTPVGIVDPCGDASGIYDEVFLKLQNGTLLASFSDNSNGKNTRFSVLTPGSYITTDGSNCFFTVDGNNNIVNQHY